jgi:hypothetical protein
MWFEILEFKVKQEFSGLLLVLIPRYEKLRIGLCSHRTSSDSITFNYRTFIDPERIGVGAQLIHHATSAGTPNQSIGSFAKSPPAQCVA